MFFFFKQKTAYEMRISDWSSDVCSSDLLQVHGVEDHAARSAQAAHLRRAADDDVARADGNDPAAGRSRQAERSSGVQGQRSGRGDGLRDVHRTARTQVDERAGGSEDRKSTRLTPVTNAQLVCRL